jgi:hypothetical protein
MCVHGTATVTGKRSAADGRLLFPGPEAQAMVRVTVPVTARQNAHGVPADSGSRDGPRDGWIDRIGTYPS